MDVAPIDGEDVAGQLDRCTQRETAGKNEEEAMVADSRSFTDRAALPVRDNNRTAMESTGGR